MRIRPSVLWFGIIIVLAASLAVWFAYKSRKNITATSQPEEEAMSADVRSATNSQTAPAEPQAAAVPQTTVVRRDNEDHMLDILSTQNDMPIVFYGKLEDQNTNVVAGADVDFSVRVYNGYEATVKRGQTVSDANGSFAISGYKGESLSVIPQKAGYAIASRNGGGFYSLLKPESERVHPDPNNPVVIKMWKLLGAEPLVGINQNYKLQYTASPIHIDLVTGKVVPSGGDLEFTVNRPDGIISQQHPQNWSIHLEAIGGGFIVTSDGEASVTYFAPEDGYQPSGTFANNNGPDVVEHTFFIRSRNGQVYSKIGLIFRINDTPDDPMYVTVGGVANANGSRNWEATVPQ